MGALAVRGGVLALVRQGSKLLVFNDNEMDRVYKKSQMNTNAHIGGASIGQAELLTASLRTIERGVVKETAKVGNGKINVADLRAMIEEYGNLAKATR